MTARERAEALLAQIEDDARVAHPFGALRDGVVAGIASAILAAEAAAYETSAEVADAEAASARRLLRRMHPSATEACAKAESAISTARGIATCLRSLATKGGDR